MLEEAAAFTNPHPSIALYGDELRLQVRGCKEVTILSLEISKGSSKEILFSLEAMAHLTIEHRKLPSSIVLDKTVALGEEVGVMMEFACDGSWVGQGTTSFSKTRSFSTKELVKAVSQPLGVLDSTPLGNSIGLLDKVRLYLDNNALSNEAIIVLMGVVAFLIFMICCKTVFTKKIKQRSKRLKEKFEEIEYVEESDDFSFERGGYAEREGDE